MNILVTGGAGFIGSNFIRYVLGTGKHRIVNYDKLTYAGNLENLAAVAGNPNYLFVKGELEDCHYLSRKNRRQDVIIVEGFALGPEGKRLVVREEFSPQIWNFTTPQAERSLQKGSDWYDMKGKRRLLPVPAHFLCNKSNPDLACLIGIDKEYVATK